MVLDCITLHSPTKLYYVFLSPTANKHHHKLLEIDFHATSDQNQSIRRYVTSTFLRHHGKPSRIPAQLNRNIPNLTPYSPSEIKTPNFLYLSYYITFYCYHYCDELKWKFYGCTRDLVENTNIVQCMVAL